MLKAHRFPVAGAALLALGACSSPTGQRPNVIILLFDDLGYGDLGCYGQSLIETPQIDSLAAQGIVFTDMYTAAPLSAPSRCSILTGLHSGHSQIRGNDERWARPEGMVLSEADWYFDAIHNNPDLEGQWPLEPGTPTLATMMRDAGYTTAMIGKWGLGGPGSGSAPRDMGFDYFYGFNCQMLAHSYYPDYLWENETKVFTHNAYMPVNRRLEPGADPLDIRSYDKFNQKDYSCDLMYERLDNWVTRAAGGDKPFFLMWTTTVPHSTVQAPEEEVMYYVRKLGEEKTPITDGGWYYPVLYPLSSYAAMITHIDTQVGHLTERLRELGIYDNTLIIITSDNGPAANSNSPGEYFRSGGPFKCRKGWGKSSLHEGGIRMPFVVSWGSHLKPGTSSYSGCFTDLYPSLACLAGGSVPEGCDGVSFVPSLLGGRQPEHEYLYWEFPASKGWLAVREGPWKGLVQNVADGCSQMELYNLSDDPQESRDVASEHPEIVKRLWQHIQDSHSPVPSGNPKFELEISYP
ncbi:MAG: arylsulfatase [Bacteroidales bacterium]|nr:arylsulfatase [Bacteroidales bacterium]